MKDKRILVLLVCLLVLAGNMTGCKKQEDTPEEVPDTVYVPAFSMHEYEFDINNGSNIYFQDMFIQGKLVYAVSHDYVGEGVRKYYLHTMDLTTGECSSRELDSEGIGYFPTPTGYVKNLSEKLLVYDTEFKKKGEIDLTAFCAGLRGEGKTLSCDEIAMDEAGRIGIISGNEFFLLNQEGELLFSAACPDGMGKFIKPVATKEGEWYVFCTDASWELQAYHVDMERCVLGERLENIPEATYIPLYEVYPVGEDSFYMVTNNYVYRYDTKTSSCSELFCLRDYGVTMDSDSHFGILEGGEPGIINELETDSRSSGIKKLELVTLTETPAEEVKPRTELVLASIYEPTMRERDAIISFNKYNPDYYVTVKAYTDMDYGTEDSAQQYELAWQSFTNDLITGKGGDIFFSSNGAIDMENLAEKGALADLYEFMDADGEIGREDFVPSILAALEYDGKLYNITPGFFLRTVVGKASLLSKYAQWDFEAMCDLMAEHPGAVLFPNRNPENALQTFIIYSMDMFYDMDTGECSFDSPEFVRMLEAAASLDTEYDVDTVWKNLGSMLRNEEILLYIEWGIGTCEQIQVLKKSFGEEIVFVGFPTSGESGTVISYYYQWAISGQSEKKEGAWEFIKSLFEEDYQKNVQMFPVMQRYFDEQIEKAMEEVPHGTSNALGIEVEVEAMSQEEAQTLRELVDSATLTEAYDTTICNIIMEEAEAYFAGQKTAEEVAEIIQDRVQLYVDEKR